MAKPLALFDGENASGVAGLWVTDGTAAGTSELSVAGATGLSPDVMTALGHKVLFGGTDASGLQDLWVTQGTAATTTELNVAGADTLKGLASYATFNAGFSPAGTALGLIAFGNKMLFSGVDASNVDNLWVTDGTANGTSELSVTGTGPNGLQPIDFAHLGSKVLFSGDGAISHPQLWITDGTSAGTSELSPTGASSFGLFAGVTPYFSQQFGNQVLFVGVDAAGNPGLWITDGTSAGTSELSPAGASPIGIFSNIFFNNIGAQGRGVVPDFTALGSKILFDGTDNTVNINRPGEGNNGIWVTDGTAAGTSELSVTGAAPDGLFGDNPFVGGDIFPDFTRLGSRLLFAGLDPTDNINLWVTDGTAAGTSELTHVSASDLQGLFPTDLTVLNGKVVFAGTDASGNRNLWVTDGTAAGTSELRVVGQSSAGLFSTGAPGARFQPDFAQFGGKLLFDGVDTSGKAALWVTDGTAAGTSELKAVANTGLGLNPFDITPFVPPCFLAGTRIRTERGEVAVEHLRVGDRVATAAGETRPIVWIGERRVDCARHPDPGLVWPVRIRAGAFADGEPLRNLWLSPDHSVFCDGVMIPIKHLVDGATILQERTSAAHYFHVELDRHDVLLAEGLPAESYLDTGNRAQFANGAVHMSLHPDFAPLSWENARAPLCTEGPRVHAVRSRLRARRMAASAVRVRAGGRSFAPVTITGSLHRFLLPGGVRELDIVAAPTLAEGRSSPVCLGGIVADGNVVPLDSTALVAGFRPLQSDVARQWRRIDGAARLRLPHASQRPVVLELLVRDLMPGREPRDAGQPARELNRNGRASSTRAQNARIALAPALPCRSGAGTAASRWEGGPGETALVTKLSAHTLLRAGDFTNPVWCGWCYFREGATITVARRARS